MSAIHTINTAMRDGCVYRVCDLAVMTQLDADTVRQALKLMVKGGVAEELPGDGYKRKKLYQTRQRQLL